MILNPQSWKRSYDEVGYVVVEDVLDQDLVMALSKGMNQIANDPDKLPDHLRSNIFYEKSHVRNNPKITDLSPEGCGQAVRQIADLALFSPIFAHLICYAPLLDILEAVFQSSEFSYHYMVGRPKEARVGNGIAWHRDATSRDFTTTNTITVLLCLDDMTAENGPNVLIPRSHQGTDEEAMNVRRRGVDEDQLPSGDQVKINCPAGSAIVFGSKILHAAKHNRSNKPRPTIITAWAGPETFPTSSIRGPYQELMPRSSSASRKNQVRMTFPDLELE